MFVLSEEDTYTARRFANEFDIPIVKPSNIIISAKKNKIELIDLHGGTILENDIVFVRKTINSQFQFSIIYSLEVLGAETINSYNTLTLLTNKSLTALVLANAGYRIPYQVLIGNRRLLDSALAAFKSFPIIIKQIKGSHGNGVVIAESKRSAKATCESLLLHNNQLILQEYARGREERALIYNSKLLGIVSKSPKKGEFRSNASRGASFQCIENVKESKINILLGINKALNAAFSAIDYIELPDKTLSILEVNGSPGIKKFEAVTGMNVPSYIKTLFHK